MYAEAPQLRKHLAEAFADVPCPYPELENLDHGKLLELTLDLAGLSAEALRYILPLILKEILDYGPDYGPGYFGGLKFETVIDNLNVLSVFPAGRARLIEQKKARFASFTPNECAALTEWLLTVREWNEPAVAFMLEDINTALTYWTER